MNLYGTLHIQDRGVKKNCDIGAKERLLFVIYLPFPVFVNT